MVILVHGFRAMRPQISPAEDSKFGAMKKRISCWFFCEDQIIKGDTNRTANSYPLPLFQRPEKDHQRPGTLKHRPRPWEGGLWTSPVFGLEEGVFQQSLPWLRWSFYVPSSFSHLPKPRRSLNINKNPVPSPNVGKRRPARVRTGNFLAGDS